MERDLEFAAAVKAAESRKEGDAHVGFFLKNLENVQGDERDVILLSVGYASSRPGKKLILNFGQLSKAGGARRLNVAITRARLGINVFCSFNPDELKTDEAAFAANPNSTTFGRYLKYARALGRGLPDEAKAILDSFGVAGVITRRKASRFSRDVARRLSERGYEVSLEVGSSGFFVDIAVHHPSIPGNYVLGVECDGALFHSLPYARDRDKARDALLTRRGWRMLRVWGPEWSRSRESELSRIEAAIREALGDPC
jgi:very-short-patch-repair endonuclease